MSTIEYLATELARAKEEISRLEAELTDARHALSRSAPIDEVEKDDLPIPRLEIEWVDEPYQCVAHYRLIYEHLLGMAVRVELGRTESRPSRSLGSPLSDGDLPFRDGAHIKSDATQLALPAFLRYGDEWVEIDPMVNRPCGAILRDRRIGKE